MTIDSPVSYECSDAIARITMDDGKANVMSMKMQEDLARAFDRAEADKAVVLFAGRERMFSGGYDMAMFRTEREQIVATLRAGGNLVHRILSFPYPVVAACSGHAVAQGAFLLLAADLRIGTIGEFKIGLNEVTIGLTIPHYGVEVARHRLSPAAFDLSAGTGKLWGPAEARDAGFLDQLVEAGDLQSTALAAARDLTRIDMGAHRGTKLRVRAGVIAAVRAGIDEELGGAQTEAG